MTSAFCNAGTVIQTRRLTQSETTPSIVFYFSVVCAIAGALTLPFAWHTPTGSELVALIALGVLGGVAHIFLTESYRFATASVVAPFDYTSMLWALMLGYWLFGELPSALVYVGAAIVAGAGLFVIWRERAARPQARTRGGRAAPAGNLVPARGARVLCLTNSARLQQCLGAITGRDRRKITRGLAIIAVAAPPIILVPRDLNIGLEGENGPLEFGLASNHRAGCSASGCGRGRSARRRLIRRLLRHRG